VAEFTNGGAPEKVIDQVLAAFESIGFVIEGGRASKIVMKTWGFPHDGVTSAWLTLRNAYKTLGKVDLAEQAKEFARIVSVLP